MPTLNVINRLVETRNFASLQELATIQGFANFVTMVNPEKGTKLQEQVRQIKDK